MQQRNDGRLAARWIILPILTHEYRSQQYYQRGLAGGGEGGRGLRMSYLSATKGAHWDHGFFQQHDAQRQMHNNS